MRLREEDIPSWLIGYARKLVQARSRLELYQDPAYPRHFSPYNRISPTRKIWNKLVVLRLRVGVEYVITSVDYCLGKYRTVLEYELLNYPGKDSSSNRNRKQSLQKVFSCLYNICTLPWSCTAKLFKRYPFYGSRNAGAIAGQGGQQARDVAIAG